MNPTRALVPYDRREAISISTAAQIADRSERTVRSWCETRHIGRRIGGGPWAVSRVALAMLLDGDDLALGLYLQGRRDHPMVASYLARFHLDVGHPARRSTSARA